MLIVLPLAVLAILGVTVGMIVAAVARSYRADRRLWPWPRRRVCGPDTPRACVRSVIHPRQAWRDPAPTLRLIGVPVVMAALFCGLGLRDAAQLLLLLVSLVEATLLLLLLVIDLDQCLVPTPVVGLLVAVALASANLSPTLGLRDALLGGAIGFASVAALVGLARLLFGAGALGLGDAFLALAIGCVTGYPLVASTLVLGIVLVGSQRAHYSCWAA